MTETEIIYISSDDEFDSQKENKTDKSVTKSAETSKEILVPAKTETVSNENDKVEENHLKRKIVHIDEEKITNNTEKKIKLTDQGTAKVINKLGLPQILMPEIRLVKADYNVQPNKSQETIENIQLIVKKKKKISYIPQDVFPLFISLCLQRGSENDKEEMNKIINKLKRRYEKLDPIYVTSENFITLLNEKRNAIMNNNKQIYVHIAEVMNEMKRKIIKNSQSLQNNEIYDAIPSTSYATNNVPVNNVESDNNDPINNAIKLDNDNEDNNEDDSEDDNERKTKKRLRIKQLLRSMERCEAKIKELEEEEVDFDQEEDSNYMKVDTYKQRIVTLYNKLCELTGENADAGRVYLRPKHLNLTQIGAVDQAITNFINSKITARNRINSRNSKRVLTDDLIFPDYRDILECVRTCNERKNLQLKPKKQEQIAKKAFKELGEHLQRTRHNDYWDTFSLYLDKNTEDPAIKDINLAKKLADNRTEGEKRLAAVFEKYTKKQQDLKDQEEDNEEKEENEEEEEMEVEVEEVEVVEEEEEEKKTEEGKEKEVEKAKEKDKETNSINDENKIDDHLSITSEKNSNNEKSTKKTINENRLLIKKNNINIVNACHSIDKVISNKTAADTSQKKCENAVEVRVVMREKNTAVSTNENKTNSKNMVHEPCNILKNVVKNVVTNMQEDSLPLASTTNCTKDLPEVKTKEVSKVITDPATKKTTKDAADTVNRVTTKLITEGIPQLVIGDTAALIMGDTTETVENAAEVITDELEIITENIDGALENMPNESEQEKKPVLRCRSFAKPPTTWEDNQHKTDKTAQKNTPKVTNQIKEIVDLTNEGTAKPPPVVKYTAVQFGKVLPIVKHHTLFIPSNNRNIINVQNITNNYLKINPQTGKIIEPVRNISGPIIRLPIGTIPTTSRQSQMQNPIIIRNEPLKGNDIVKVRKVLISKNQFVSKKPTVQSVSKQTDVSSPTSKSK